MSTIVFFLEEQSASEMLEGVLPKIIPQEIAWKVFFFHGKSDLEKNLQKKLRGWRLSDTFFIILRDKDASDCIAIKRKYVDMCSKSGRTNWLVRIACSELESWYLGDLFAVEKGLGLSGLAQLQGKVKFRNPDSLQNAADELMKLTNNKYGKVAGSRCIGPYLSLSRNNSHSFNIFVSGINKAIQTLTYQGGGS